MTRTLMFLIVKKSYICDAQIFHCFIIWFLALDTQSFGCVFFVFIIYQNFLHKFVKTSKGKRSHFLKKIIINF